MTFLIKVYDDSKKERIEKKNFLPHKLFEKVLALFALFHSITCQINVQTSRESNEKRTSHLMEVIRMH
jgi:hypothetical protein